MTALGGAIGLALAALTSLGMAQAVAQFFPVLGMPPSTYAIGAVLIVVLGGIAAALPCVAGVAAEDRRCIEEGVRWPATSLSQICRDHFDEPAQRRGARRLVRGRAGRHRRRRHRADRRAVDRRRLSRRARPVRPGGRRDRPAQRRHRRDGQLACATTQTRIIADASRTRRATQKARSLRPSSTSSSTCR